MILYVLQSSLFITSHTNSITCSLDSTMFPFYIYELFPQTIKSPTFFSEKIRQHQKDLILNQDLQGLYKRYIQVQRQFSLI